MEALQREAAVIQRFTEVTLSEDMAEAVMRGSELIAYIARTGKMLADAKYHLNAKRQSEVVGLVERIMSKNKLSAKVQNAMVDGIAKEEEHLVDTVERLNRTCTHQMEWCRTLVSKGKEEMRLANVAGREFSN